MSDREDTRVRAILAQREVVARVSEQEKAERAKLKQMETEFIAFLQDKNTKTWVSGDGGMRATVRRTRKARILNKTTLVKSLKALGLAEEMLRPEPRLRTLNQYVKTMEETGNPLPEGLDYYDDLGLTITKK